MIVKLIAQAHFLPCRASYHLRRSDVAIQGEKQGVGDFVPRHVVRDKVSLFHDKRRHQKVADRGKDAGYRCPKIGQFSWVHFTLTRNGALKRGDRGRCATHSRARVGVRMIRIPKLFSCSENAILETYSSGNHPIWIWLKRQLISKNSQGLPGRHSRCLHPNHERPVQSHRVQYRSPPRTTRSTPALILGCF